MIVATILTRPLLELLGTPDTILDWCSSYLHIMFIGISGMAFYNILSGILRGMGDSISALLYLLVASGLNIVLDLLLVVKFEMGVPSGLTQAIMSMAMLVVKSLTNSFGEQFIAANVIVMRVDGFAMLPNFSFGTAMTTYAGQNIGAKKFDRVTQGAKQGTFMGLAVSAAITATILFFGRPFMSIFTGTESLVNLSMSMMKILAVGYLAMAIIQSLSGVMRGAGDTVTPMWISIIMTIIIRVPITYGLACLTRSPELPQGRQESVYISLLISWILGAIMTGAAYRRGKWKKKAINF